MSLNASISIVKSILNQKVIFEFGYWVFICIWFMVPVLNISMNRIKLRSSWYSNKKSYLRYTGFQVFQEIMEDGKSWSDNLNVETKTKNSIGTMQQWESVKRLFHWYLKICSTSLPELKLVYGNKVFRLRRQIIKHSIPPKKQKNISLKK